MLLCERSPKAAGRWAFRSQGILRRKKKCRWIEIAAKPEGSEKTAFTEPAETPHRTEKAAACVGAAKHATCPGQDRWPPRNVARVHWTWGSVTVSCLFVGLQCGRSNPEDSTRYCPGEQPERKHSFPCAWLKPGARADRSPGARAGAHAGRKSRQGSAIFATSES